MLKSSVVSYHDDENISEAFLYALIIFIQFTHHNVK